MSLDTREASARGEGREQEGSLAGHLRPRRGSREASLRRRRLDEGGAPALGRVLLRAEEGAASAKAPGQGPDRAAAAAGGAVRRRPLAGAVAGRGREGGRLKRQARGEGRKTWAFPPREMGPLEGCGHWKEVTGVYACYPFIPLFPSRHIQQAPSLGLGWSGQCGAAEKSQPRVLPSEVSQLGRWGHRAGHRHSRPCALRA